MARAVLVLALASLLAVPSLVTGLEAAPVPEDPAPSVGAAPLPRLLGDDPEEACLGPLEDVPAQGPSCRVSFGWKVFLADGSAVFTHGPDELEEGEEPVTPAYGYEDGVLRPGGDPTDLPDVSGLLPAGSSPVCTTNPLDYQGHVIYAAPVGEGRHATIAPHLRNIVKQANGILRAAGELHGADVNYRMRCDVTGEITVEDLALPISGASVSFSSVISEVKARGFASPNEKYWIWWDGGMGSIAGQAEFINDDRPGVDNANNRGPSYAVTWGVLSTRVMMHENGHNLGAVQDSAPSSSGGAHCNDGRDIMCYADGGSKSQYTSAACPDREHFDCHNDDYFHAGSPIGYLANHWNLGSPANRFFDFCGGPLAGAGRDLAVCSAAAPLWTRPGESIAVKAVVRNNGATAEPSVRVTFRHDGAVVEERILSLAAHASAEVEFSWTSSQERAHDLAVAVDPAPGDTNAKNDQRVATVRVVTPAGHVRVAVFDSGGTDATRYFGFQRLAERWFEYGSRTIEYDTRSLNKVNVTLADLRATGADVILVPDANGGNPAWPLTADEAAALEEYLHEGHGLLATHGTLSRTAPSNAALLPLLGVTGTGTECFAPQAQRVVAWDGPEPALKAGVATPYVTGVDCGFSPPVTASGATRVASSLDNYFQAYAYRHKAAGLGAGAGLFLSWEPHVTGYGANRDDLQVAYNAAVWLDDASAPLLADRGVARLEVPPVACIGHDYAVRAVVRNYGTTATGATTARVLVDGVVKQSWSLGALAAGSETPLLATLAPPAGGVNHTVTVDVTTTGDPATKNNAKSANFTLQTCRAPSLPLGLDAFAGPGAGEATLRVVPPAQDGGTPVTHYQVIRDGVVVARVKSAAGLTYRDAGLAADTTYQYRVAAENGAGAGRPSVEVTVTTFNAALPGAPTLAVSQGHEQVTLTMTPAAVPGAQPPSSYRVYRAEGAGPESHVATVAGSTWTNHFLMDGKTFTYRVVPVNAAGEGPSSAPVTVRVLRGHSAASAVWTGSGTLLFGGWTGIAESRVLRHDPATGLYEVLPTPLPTARYGTSAVWDARTTAACPTGCAYVFGGFSAAHGRLRDVVRYDPAAGTAAVVALLPTGRGAASAAWDAATHTAYLFGGNVADNTYTDEVLAFDPDTLAVTVKAARMPGPVTSTSAVWTGTHAYAFGGWNASGSLDWIVKYDPATDAVTKLTAKLPGARELTAAAFDGTHAYVFGGHLRKDVIRFTPATEAVTTMTHKLPTDRYYMPAVWDGQHATTFGGALYDGNAFSALAWTYLVAPAAPPGAKAVATSANQTVTVSWGAPAANGHNEITAFEVHRGLSSGRETLLATLGPDARVYADATAPEGQTSYYRVLAVNEGRDAGTAATVAASMATDALPPSGFAATRGPGMGEVSLAWATPTDDGGAAVTAYRLYRGTSPASLALVAELPSGTTPNLLSNGGFESGIVPWKRWGTACTFATATNWSVEGAKSERVKDASATAACGTYQELAPPVVGRTYTFTGTMRLDWGAAAVRLDFVSASNQTLPGSTSVTFTTPGTAPFTLAGVAPTGTTKVRAWAVYVPGSAQGEAYADALALTDGSIVATQAYRDTGLASGTTYRYAIASVNAMGEGERAVASAATYAATPPAAPAAPTATRGGSGVVQLAWQPPADNGSPAVTGYKVYRGTSPGALTLAATLGNVLAWTDGGRTNGVTYHYAVAALNSQGEGAASGEASVTAAGPPGAPTDLNACSSRGNVLLSWTPPGSDGGLSVSAYRVYRRTTLDAETNFVVGNVTSHTDAGLTAGTRYTYEVAAITAAGEGARSAPATATAVTGDMEVVCNT